MKTFLTVIGVVFGVILVTLGGIAIYANMWWKDITFKPDIQGIKNKLPSIILSLFTNQKIPVTVLVDNDNGQGLTLKDFQIKGRYNGSDVFQSNVIPIIAIPANAKDYAINGELELFANQNTIKLGNEVLKNTKPVVDLTITLSKFGFTRSFTFPYPVTL